MTHGRKPRCPRPVKASPFVIARNNATRLTDAERTETLTIAKECLYRLRTGTATEGQHTVFNTQILIAQGIEASGIVRGMGEVFSAATQAMAAIRARALANVVWRPTALYPTELVALQEFVRMHDFQLQQLSAGELHAITRKLIAQTLSQGGAAEHCTLEEMELFGATA